MPDLSQAKGPVVEAAAAAIIIATFLGYAVAAAASGYFPFEKDILVELNSDWNIEKTETREVLYHVYMFMAPIRRSVAPLRCLPHHLMSLNLF